KNASLADGHVAYVKSQHSTASSETPIQGLDAVVAAPPATAGAAPAQFYGVATNQNALLVINVDGGTQRQLFVDGQNNVTGLKAPTGIASTGADGYVFVASASNHTLAEFKLNSTTGDLTFVTSKSYTGNYSHIGYSNGSLVLSGSDGVATI